MRSVHLQRPETTAVRWHPTGRDATNCRIPPSRRECHSRQALEALGTLSQRARLGQRARGLQCPYGTAWDYLPHDHARSRAYRWNEDGLAGICDRHQRICFALALWNRRDPILKERLFGLTGNEGNHGEDVKEHYFYLDSTPTHSLHAVPLQVPAGGLPVCTTSSRRTGGAARTAPEYELVDTGVFDGQTATSTSLSNTRRPTPDDILIRITVTNRGPERADLDVLPTIWFRNTWSWSNDAVKPTLAIARSRGANRRRDDATARPDDS